MNKIKIDIERVVADIDRKIFGNFAEHLGRCIYGGIYEEDSPLSDENGFRKDVMEAVKGLRVPILRWPGGNFVSGYHWLDGVGPKDERPRRVELAWHSEESNRFGTVEFIEYCRKIGAEPYICVNLGTGTLDEAQAWVEYCNGTGNTYYANLRRQHGYEEPFNVKYWGLGNEMYGSWQIGAKKAEDYAAYAMEAAKLMRWTDPSIKLVSCGHNGLTEWDRIVLEKLAPIVDYHSIHLYTGSPEHYDNIAHVYEAERCIKATVALIERIRFEQKIDHPIYIAFDEWNVWYRARGWETLLEERYDLSDALAVATYLNCFLRNSQTVRIANMAQLVNVIAPIFTSPEGLFLQTIYHPLKLYVDHVGELCVDTWVDAPTYTSEKAWQREIPVLDAVATFSPDKGTCVVTVINSHLENCRETSIEFTSGEPEPEVEVYTLTGDDPHITNDFDHPDRIAPRRSTWNGGGKKCIYSFPPLSLTVLKFRVK